MQISCLGTLRVFLDPGSDIIVDGRLQFTVSRTHYEARENEKMVIAEIAVSNRYQQLNISSGTGCWCHPHVWEVAKTVRKINRPKLILSH